MSPPRVILLCDKIQVKTKELFILILFPKMSFSHPSSGVAVFTTYNSLRKSRWYWWLCIYSFPPNDLVYLSQHGDHAFCEVDKGLWLRCSDSLICHLLAFYKSSHCEDSSFTVEACVLSKDQSWWLPFR